MCRRPIFSVILMALALFSAAAPAALTSKILSKIESNPIKLADFQSELAASPIHHCMSFVAYVGLADTGISVTAANDSFEVALVPATIAIERLAETLFREFSPGVRPLLKNIFEETRHVRYEAQEGGFVASRAMRGG